MKKTELKALLKPLIKECIKEVMFEDGVLSGIVSEVATGMGGIQIVEARHREQPKAKATRARKQENFAEMRQESLQEQRREVDEHKKKLLDAIGNEAYNGINLFEGTAPLKSGGSSAAGGASQGALANVDSSDPGVDISNLFGKVGRNWQAHLNAEK
jgi:hypothetical protein|tara:strand:+ start:262 stop:732 length:471 start_codon:yes stop_codon:yes gene_type:complete